MSVPSERVLVVVEAALVVDCVVAGLVLLVVIAVVTEEDVVVVVLEVLAVGLLNGAASASALLVLPLATECVVSVAIEACVAADVVETDAAVPDEASAEVVPKDELIVVVWVPVAP
mmetsp:Transcript_30549/g.71339  ORF Transcript_30549/g.71339 Transcript_30549/m.71339 type:complete len:116 (+) Transcript_30549:1339-1686(+)